jgi:hypothetical protein
MSSFIHLNNREDQAETKYSATMVKIALLKTETKSVAKANDLVKNIVESVSLNEALLMFSDKLKAIKFLGEARSSIINEGQFSWMTQDTGNQIGSEKQNTIAVYIFNDKGDKWQERRYEGYGVFGGKDYYELLAQMNGIENADRQDGIDLAFGKKKIKGKVLFPALVEDPKRFDFKKHDFTQEPENDPNQSWYQEEEEDDYNESLVSETLFYAFFNNKKIEIEGKDLWDAKQQAITQLKVPKSKVGYLAVVSAESQKNQDFKFESEEITEAEVNEAVSNLVKYVEDASQKTFKGGGNGQNLLDNATELADHIESYQKGRDTRGYEEDGFYGPATITLFKRLVDQMSADDIKDNQASKYESLDVNEARSINKIQKEWSDTTTKMQQKAGEWKAAEGDRKSELLDEMKALTAKKKELEAELDAAVAGKDKDLELVVSEGNAFTGALFNAKNKGEETFEFNGKTFKVSGAKKVNEDDVEVTEGNAFGAARAKAIADGEKEFEVEGETYKVEDLDKEDKANAKDFVEESKTTLDALVEMFEVKTTSTLNEDLRTEIKSYIKKNEKELNELADKDEWDLIYKKLYTEFDVEEGTAKAKELLKTFQFTF